jgi:N-acetylglucosaminyl-diphospho-decaprenol L-rhamnosyltransferase
MCSADLPSPDLSSTADPDPLCDLSIVIVHWNVVDLLIACLQSIEAASRPPSPGATLRSFGPAGQASTLEVIVVDSASSDDVATRISTRFPWVHLIVSETNLGFTAGNNLGYGASSGRFVFFLNPDTEIFKDETGSDSLWTLYAAIRSDETIGIAGPQLRYADGTVQSSRRRFPTRLTGFFESTWLGAALPVNPWSKRMHMDDRRISGSHDVAWHSVDWHDVDWIVGAAMLARRQALEQVRMPQYAGPFDEGFFMYSEESDLCLRIKSAGWRVRYVPESTIIHYEGRSSEQVVAARHIHFNTSKVRYYRKHFGPGWSAALRRYLLFEFRMQIWIERAKLLLGSKPELRQARIDAYRQVLDSGLHREMVSD